jgi:hypothetical protein
MRLKETIRLIKKALSNPNLYTEDEITYMRKHLDTAILTLARKKFNKKKKGFGNTNETH